RAADARDRSACAACARAAAAQLRGSRPRRWRPARHHLVFATPTGRACFTSRRFPPSPASARDSEGLFPSGAARHLPYERERVAETSDAAAAGVRVLVGEGV